MIFFVWNLVSRWRLWNWFRLLSSYLYTIVGFPTIWETISFSVTVAISTPDEANHPDVQFSLTTVSIKLATFWTDSLEMWFLQAVSQFVINLSDTSPESQGGYEAGSVLSSAFSFPSSSSEPWKSSSRKTSSSSSSASPRCWGDPCGEQLMSPSSPEDQLTANQTKCIS